VKTLFAKEGTKIAALMIDQAFPKEEKTENGNKVTELL